MMELLSQRSWRQVNRSLFPIPGKVIPGSIGNFSGKESGLPLSSHWNARRGLLGPLILAVGNPVTFQRIISVFLSRCLLASPFRSKTPSSSMRSRLRKKDIGRSSRALTMGWGGSETTIVLNTATNDWQKSWAIPEKNSWEWIFVIAWMRKASNGSLIDTIGDREGRRFLPDMNLIFVEGMERSGTWRSVP